MIIGAFTIPDDDIKGLEHKSINGRAILSDGMNTALMEAFSSPRNDSPCERTLDILHKRGYATHDDITDINGVRVLMVDGDTWFMRVYIMGHGDTTAIDNAIDSAIVNRGRDPMPPFTLLGSSMT